MKALVVGGTGFLGMNVSRALHRAGHDVIATRREHTNTLFARKLGVRLVRAELDDVAALTAAMRGRDVVFMCAAHYPRWSLDGDREVDRARARIRNALEAARRARVARIVLTSSVATVGPPARDRHATEDDPIDPRALRCAYHRVKQAIEDEARDSQLDVVTLLPTAVFGELDVKAGTGFLIVALANGVLPFFVDGRINVVDADDVARAHLLAAERGLRGERYIVGGHNLTVAELVDRLDGVSTAVPAWLGALAATFAELRSQASGGRLRPFLSRELVDVVRFGQWVRSDKAVRELGLGEPTPLHSTLNKARDWYRRHRYIGAPDADHSPRTDSARPRRDHSSLATGSPG